VVSFQRPTRAALVGAMKWLKEVRPDVGLVVELDDDLLHLHPAHEAFGALDPRKNSVENVAWLRQALLLADVVTVSTPELAKRYGGNRPVHVIRNAIPEEMLTQYPSRALSSGVKDHRRVIGWAGYVGTHPGDLEVTSGAIGDVLAANPDLRFRNVGPWEGLIQALGLPEELHNRVQFAGWLEPTLYRAGLSELDIGIVPLADTAFNRAKSTLKALEMAAAGVPVVASDLPEFRALRAEGLPLWLVKPRRREWVGALSRLCALDDDELRLAATQHRRWVASYGTVDKRAPEWASAWRYAASVAQRRTNGARAAS
jgi:glycosyltransferase involved in cell wall biosynthesis